MTKTEELLAVLDLPEDEQCNWLSRNTNISFPSRLTGREHLAYIAFRLRNEVCSTWQCKNDYDEAIDKILIKLEVSVYDMANGRWWQQESKPIHWIIAALIAKAEE